ncbi:hypothetical protein, conserved [Entamoeba histolytica]
MLFFRCLDGTSVISPESPSSDEKSKEGTGSIKSGQQTSTNELPHTTAPNTQTNTNEDSQAERKDPISTSTTTTKDITKLSNGADTLSKSGAGKQEHDGVITETEKQQDKKEKGTSGTEQSVKVEDSKDKKEDGSTKVRDKNQKSGIEGSSEGKGSEENKDNKDGTIPTTDGKVGQAEEGKITQPDGQSGKTSEGKEHYTNEGQGGKILMKQENTIIQRISQIKKYQKFQKTTWIITLTVLQIVNLKSNRQ